MECACCDCTACDWFTWICSYVSDETFANFEHLLQHTGSEVMEEHPIKFLPYFEKICDLTPLNYGIVSDLLYLMYVMYFDK